MSSIKRYKVLYDSANTTGNWIALDSRYDDGDNVRSIQIDITGTSSVSIQGTTRDVKGIDKSFLDTLPATDISTLNTVTADTAMNLEGPWTYIRVVAVGAGAVKVQGFV